MYMHSALFSAGAKPICETGKCFGRRAKEAATSFMERLCRMTSKMKSEM